MAPRMVRCRRRHHGIEHTHAERFQALEQRVDGAEIATALAVHRHVGRNINHVAGAEVRGSRREALASRVGGDKPVEPGSDTGNSPRRTLAMRASSGSKQTARKHFCAAQTPDTSPRLVIPAKLIDGFHFHAPPALIRAWMRARPSRAALNLNPGNARSTALLSKGR